MGEVADYISTHPDFPLRESRGPDGRPIKGGVGNFGKKAWGILKGWIIMNDESHSKIPSHNIESLVDLFSEAMKIDPRNASSVVMQAHRALQKIIDRGALSPLDVSKG